MTYWKIFSVLFAVWVLSLLLLVACEPVSGRIPFPMLASNDNQTKGVYYED